jgi:phosphatidylglycerol:prolipoprotein diacylglycerol transferase
MFPDTPLFSIGSLHIYPYGVCMALGIVLCFVFIYWALTKLNFNESAIDTILYIGIFGTAFGIFSAMLFQSVYNVLAGNAFNLGSSMTFLGGLIGGVVGFLGVYYLYIYLIAPRTKWKWLQFKGNATLTDALPVIPIGISIAHGFGRLGCFFGGCCYGVKTDGTWGIACSEKYGGLSGGVLVVPTQLFEMIFLFVLAAVMFFLWYKRKFNCNFGLYAIAYGIWRFCLEFVRGDYRGGVEGAPLSPSQYWSIVMVLVGVGYFFAYKYWFKKNMKHPELQPSVRQSKNDQKGTAQ